MGKKTSEDEPERAHTVGILAGEDMRIKWAVYHAREVQVTSAHAPALMHRVGLECTFVQEGESFTVIGEHFVDPIALSRMLTSFAEHTARDVEVGHVHDSRREWDRKLVELARKTVTSAMHNATMH